MSERVKTFLAYTAAAFVACSLIVNLVRGFLTGEWNW